MRSFGRYQIVRELEEPGVDVAYLGTDPAIGRDVVILANSVTRYYIREQYLNDIRAAASISHPNIVAVRETGRERDLDYAVMEFVSGRTLERTLTEGLLATEMSLRILTDLAQALDHLHSYCIVHDHVIPPCIVIRSDGVAQVTPPAIAKLQYGGYELAPHTWRMDSLFENASPERLRGEPQRTGSSDQFSVAAVAYRLFTGHKPFTGETISALVSKILFAEAEPAHSVNPRLDPRMGAVLAKGMAKDPSGRFDTCTDFVKALRTGAGEQQR